MLKDRLLHLFKDRAISFGNFTLASGKQSLYYIDSKKAMFHYEIIGLLAPALYEATSDLNIEAAGGLEVGAIPLATVLAYEYDKRDRVLEGFFVRKEVKEHGSKQRIEGRLTPGMRVAILDDVLTTGSSALQAVEAVERAGAIVTAVVCIVDRLEGARAAIEAKCPFRPIFTIRDFGVSV